MLGALAAPSGDRATFASMLSDGQAQVADSRKQISLARGLTVANHNLNEALIHGYGAELLKLSKVYNTDALKLGLTQCAKNAQPHGKA
jgi:hypothetical protein